MSSSYPANIDNSSTLPVFNNNINANKLNALRQAVLNIQIELGADPSFVYSSVRARLDSIENSLNQIIDFGVQDASTLVKGVLRLSGDLAGTANSPLVVGLNGKTINTTASDGYALVYSSGTDSYVFSKVIPPDSTSLLKGVVKLSGDFSGTADSPQVIGLYGKSLSIAGQSNGYVLTYSAGTDSYVFSNVTPSDATSSTKGVLQLTNDLSGTAALPQVSGILNIPVNNSGQLDGYALLYNSTSLNYKFSKINPSSYYEVQFTGTNTITGTGSNSYMSVGQSSIDTANFKSYNTYQLTGFAYVLNGSNTNTLTISLFNLTTATEIATTTVSATNSTSFTIAFTPTNGLNSYEIRTKIDASSPSINDGYFISNIKVRIY